MLSRLGTCAGCRRTGPPASSWRSGAGRRASSGGRRSRRRSGRCGTAGVLRRLTRASAPLEGEQGRQGPTGGRHRLRRRPHVHPQLEEETPKDSHNPRARKVHRTPVALGRRRSYRRMRAPCNSPLSLDCTSISLRRWMGCHVETYRWGHTISPSWACRAPRLLRPPLIPGLGGIDPSAHARATAHDPHPPRRPVRLADDRRLSIPTVARELAARTARASRGVALAPEPPARQAVADRSLARRPRRTPFHRGAGRPRVVARYFTEVLERPRDHPPDHHARRSDGQRQARWARRAAERTHGGKTGGSAADRRQAAHGQVSRSSRHRPAPAPTERRPATSPAAHPLSDDRQARVLPPRRVRQRPSLGGRSIRPRVTAPARCGREAAGRSVARIGDLHRSAG
jgi:hypothetical protein